MTSRRALTATTLTVLLALLVTGAVVGWRALTAPTSSGTDDPASACDAVRRGEVVRTRDVTVSVLNAGTVAGLAERVQRGLVTRGFRAGDLGNAPDELAGVRRARVLAPGGRGPATRLVALQLGRRTPVGAVDPALAAELGSGVLVVVGDDFTRLVDAPRRVVARQRAGSC